MKKNQGSHQQPVMPELVAWVRPILQQHAVKIVDDAELNFTALNGDAGFRHYFRLNTQPSLLAVIAPATSENNHAFVAVANYFRENGIHVPKVLEAEFQQGLLLIEDLGHSLYLDHLVDETVDTLYSEALMSLLRIQQSPINSAVLPLYDRAKLLQELHLFVEWFAGQLLEYPLAAAEHRMLEQFFDLLINSALEQPQVAVHRDFHSRNIVYVEDGSPGIIDFQDAVIGPVTYDLVSLLRDCYIAWDPERVKQWAIAYANMAVDADIMQRVSEATFMRWFDWMGLQRHLKVLGIFSRLSLRDGKHRYLNDLPLVLDYVLNILGKYSEFKEPARWFEAKLLPIIAKQKWKA